MTLSGGEVLARDLDYVENLMKCLKRRGIRINVDTCGAVPWQAIERVLPYTDVFLFDTKVKNTGFIREEIIRKFWKI